MSVSNQQVCHFWASGNKDSATGFSVQFAGRRLYSWGSHYLLGFKMLPATFFINSSWYSISTSKHQSLAERATHGRTYSIPGLTTWERELTAISDYATLPDKAASIDRAAAKTAALRAVSRMIDGLAPALSGAPTAGEYKRTVERAALLCLADCAGLTVKQANEMIDKASRAANAKASKAATKQAAIQRAYAVQFAKVPRADWKGPIDEKLAIIRTGTDYQARDAIHAINYVTKEAGRIHREASKAGLSKATVGKIWERVKYGRALLAEINANADRLAARRAFLSNAETFRDCLKNLAIGTLDRMTVWDSLHLAAGNLLVSGKLSPVLRAKLIAMRDCANVAATGMRREAEKLRAIEQAEKVTRWRNGERLAGFYCPSIHGGAMVRAIDVTRGPDGQIDGGTLETSQGASVPLVHAIKVFRFVKLCREAGKDWHHNGHSVRVGYYTLDSISADGDFVAGCHRFTWPEIQALAVSLGVWDLPASDVAVTPTYQAA